MNPSETDTLEALSSETKSIARLIKRASQEMSFDHPPEDAKIGHLQTQIRRFQHLFEQSGYHHRLAEEMARESGLSDLVPSPPRGGPYFETPPGTALLPLWEYLVCKPGSADMLPDLAETFFLTAAGGMKPERSKILIQKILDLKDQDRMSHLQLQVEQIFRHSTSYNDVLGLKRFSDEPQIVKQRTEAIFSHFTKPPVKA